MKVPDELLKNICKIGQGDKCCRFLACGSDGFECLKHTSLAATLNARVVAGTMNAIGDNCDGLQNQMSRAEKEQYLAESIAELRGVENNSKMKAAISALTDAELDVKVEFADYLEGK
jgi:hypothetical protein